jgi:cytochrome c oxidase assembly factor CtaG
MRALAAALIVLLLPAQAALAHGGASHVPEPAWSFDPWVTLPLLLSLLLYLLGTATVWRHAGSGRGIRRGQVAAYLLGWLCLAAALVSPLHWLGEHLFVAHMVEHEIVMVLAAPLLVLSRPLGAALWALPQSSRRALGKLGHGRLWRDLWHRLTRPAVATLLHALAIWIWHLPVLFDATVTQIAMHRAQHLSFLLSALLFWWSLRRRRDPAVAAGHLFVTMAHTGILGALLTFAPRVLYANQTAQAPLWGLTPLEDQQLAGLVMWVPGGIVYAGAALVCIASWIRRAGRATEDAHVRTVP